MRCVFGLSARKIKCGLAVPKSTRRRELRTDPAIASSEADSLSQIGFSRNMASMAAGFAEYSNADGPGVATGDLGLEISGSRSTFRMDNLFRGLKISARGVSRRLPAGFA